MRSIDLGQFLGTTGDHRDAEPLRRRQETRLRCATIDRGQTGHRDNGRIDDRVDGASNRLGVGRRPETEPDNHPNPLSSHCGRGRVRTFAPDRCTTLRCRRVGRDPRPCRGRTRARTRATDRRAGVGERHSVGRVCRPRHDRARARSRTVDRRRAAGGRRIRVGRGRRAGCGRGRVRRPAAGRRAGGRWRCRGGRRQHGTLVAVLADRPSHVGVDAPRVHRATWRAAVTKRAMASGFPAGWVCR